MFSYAAVCQELERGEGVFCAEEDLYTYGFTSKMFLKGYTNTVIANAIEQGA